MPSFNENLNRLRAGSRASTKDAMAIETAAANERGQAGIKHVSNIRSKLEPFSGHLRDWKKLDIAHQEKIGKREARKARKEQQAKIKELQSKIGRIEGSKDLARLKLPPALQLNENEIKNGLSKERKREIDDYLKVHPYGGGYLQDEFDSIEAQHDALNKMKGELLHNQEYLADAYPDAARIEKLGPHAQVGYAKEKLRLHKEKWPDELQYWLQNSGDEIEIEINGNAFTVVPKDFHDVLNMDDGEEKDDELKKLFGGKDDQLITTLADVNHLQVVEAVLDKGSDMLFEKLGLDQYSDDMLELTGIEDIMQSTKEKINSTARAKFLVVDSANVRGKALVQWNNSNKTSKDLERVILQSKWTADAKGNLLGNSGGLDFAFKQLAQMGVTSGNTGIADTYGEMPLPPSFAQELGVPVGTTWAEKWPGRFKSLRTDIKSGIVKAVNAEREYQESFGTELNNRFTEEVRQSATAGTPMTTDRANWYKDQFGKAGLPIPSDVLKWESTSQRDARKDKDLINALKDSQGGVITNQQLDTFNPSAASEFRKEADSYEKDLLEEYNVENLIKASLDQTFTGMGLKGNEKNRIYQEAFKNAKIDYIKQFNKLRNMGLDEAHANYLALNGSPGEGKDTEGQPLVGFHGVLHEIDTKGEGSKYVITGQNVQDSLGDAFVRVGYINTAKKQIQKNKNSVTTGLLGGQYGQDQMNIIAANIEKYGLDRGLNMSDEAVEFYRGIARGTDLRSTGGWMGILDAQLKANIPGHEGLWPKGDQPSAVSLLTGVNGDGQQIPDPTGLKPLTDQAMRAIANADSYTEFVYAVNLLQDAGYDTSSIFDQPENLVNYLGE